MNHAILKGNLATDPRLRTTATGKEVCSFKLAVNRPGQDAGADFIWIKTWNGSATACNTYLKKGSPVLVDGEIRTSRVGEGDSMKEYVEVNARSVQFLATRNGGNDAPPPTDDNMPEAVVASTAVPADATPAQAEDTATPVVEDDDIPF